MIINEGLLRGPASLKVYFEKRYQEASWEQLSYARRRQRLTEEQNGRCKICGISEWNEQPLSFRLDHIDGDRTNNVKENCRMICPNCDSQLPTYCGRNKTTRRNVTDEVLVESLKRNGLVRYRVLKDLGLAPSKSIYARLEHLKSTLN